ncbi:MAG: hypothetical protein P8Z78_11760, partial [Gammaproteobacteria bacterium]
PPYAALSAENGSRSGGDQATPCQEKLDEIKDHDLSIREVPLRVWTSEGVTRSKRVCVVYDPDEVMGKTSEESKPADSVQTLLDEVADEATAVP